MLPGRSQTGVTPAARRLEWSIVVVQETVRSRVAEEQGQPGLFKSASEPVYGLPRMAAAPRTAWVRFSAFHPFRLCSHSEASECSDHACLRMPEGRQLHTTLQQFCVTKSRFLVCMHSLWGTTHHWDGAEKGEKRHLDGWLELRSVQLTEVATVNLRLYQCLEFGISGMLHSFCSGALKVQHRVLCKAAKGTEERSFQGIWLTDNKKSGTCSTSTGYK